MYDFGQKSDLLNKVKFGRVNLQGGKFMGQAEVSVRDNRGLAVVGATVHGVFTGPTNDRVSAVTDNSGVAVLLSSEAFDPTDLWGFSVGHIDGDRIAYDSARNVTGYAQESPHQSRPAVPVTFALSQNYPNQFNPSTQIDFTIPYAANVRLELFNTLGQRVGVLLNNHVVAGPHTVWWHSGDHASGIYIYRLTTPYESSSKKMILVR